MNATRSIVVGFDGSTNSKAACAGPIRLRSESAERLSTATFPSVFRWQTDSLTHVVGISHTRTGISGDISVNEHGAVGIGGAKFAHRADQHSRELAMPTTAYNQEISSVGSCH
jgi:hypothetical protein